MDSRPHDDFFPPERSVPDDASRPAETVSAGDAASAAQAQAPDSRDLYDAIDDLELELAGLLTPDLEAMDIEAVELDAAGLGTLDIEAELGAIELEAALRAAPGAEATDRDARDVDAAGRPEAAPAASGPAVAELPAAEPALALPPETAEARTDAAPETVRAEAFETDMLIEAIELELSLDAADGTIAPEAEAAEAPANVADTGTVVADGSGDTDFEQAATVAVAQDEVLPAGDEAAAGIAATGSEADEPVAAAAPADEPLDGSLGPMPVADMAAPAGEEHETPVEAVADAAPEAGPVQAVEPALPVIAEAPATADAPAAEAGGEAPGDETGASAVEAEATAEVEAAEHGGAEIVLPEAITAAPRQDDVPAEAAAFEQALGAQDILANGFEAAVRSAAAQAAGRFLFQMPVHTVRDCQRVAAVNLAGDASPATVLVLLAADGRSFRLEDARASDNPFAGMAVSYGGLLAHLKSLPTRAAA